MLGRLADNRTDVEGTGHKLVNNLSYGARRGIISIEMAKCELSGNSFTSDVRLTDSDFVSLDEAEITAPRQPDGQLPVLKFLVRKSEVKP